MDGHHFSKGLDDSLFLLWKELRNILMINV